MVTKNYRFADVAFTLQMQYPYLEKQCRSYEVEEPGIEVVVYEPAMKEETFFNSRVIRDLKEFKEMSDVILANRCSDEIADVMDKVYTRDLYFRD